MKILLTGHSGFLGKYLADYLKDKFDLYTLSRSSNGHFSYDLEKEIPDFNIKFDLVIHAAGNAHFNSQNKTDSELFYKSNVIGTLNLLNGLSNSEPPKQFLFISSVSVYGLTNGYLIDENAPLNANDPYGKSKIEAESLINNWCIENKVTSTVFRLPLIVGINPPGNLGAMIKGIVKGYYFNIGGGNAKKSMLRAEDIAVYVVKAAEIGGIFNLTDGYHPTFLDISKLICRQLGKRLPLNMPFCLAYLIALMGDLFGEKALLNRQKLNKITSNLTFDDTKARYIFGWNPSPVLESMFIANEI